MTDRKPMKVGVRFQWENIERTNVEAARDDLLSAVAAGMMTRSEGEAKASQEGLEPLLSRADVAAFDPLCEPETRMPFVKFGQRFDTPI